MVRLPARSLAPLGQLRAVITAAGTALAPVGPLGVQLSNMSSMHPYRGPAPRGDREILADNFDMALLRAVEAGQVIRASRSAVAAYLLGGQPVALKHLAREDLLYAPIGGPPVLAARGRRLLAVARGELPSPPDE